MFPILELEQARKTILKRMPMDEMIVTPALAKRLEETFGQPVSPAEAVSRILKDIRGSGDQALRNWTKRLDGVDLENPVVPAAEIQAAMDGLAPDLRAALMDAAARIRAFYEKQPKISWVDQSMGGTLGQLIRPMERVGVYVPGGTAPLPSTVLMSAIPARVAGVREVVVITPPTRETGLPNPVILAAAAIAGVDTVYMAGGAQAIAALAYGTESILILAGRPEHPGQLFGIAHCQLTAAVQHPQPVALGFHALLVQAVSIVAFHKITLIFQPVGFVCILLAVLFEFRIYGFNRGHDSLPTIVYSPVR